MNIESQGPELEALIQQRMATGRFRNVEDVLLQALRSAEEHEEFAPVETGASLVDVLARARVLLEGEELDLTRDPSPGRPVDFS